MSQKPKRAGPGRPQSAGPRYAGPQSAGPESAGPGAGKPKAGGGRGGAGGKGSVGQTATGVGRKGGKGTGGVGGTGVGGTGVGGTGGMARAAANPMDLGMLEQLVKLMSANDLSAVDLRDGDKRVVLRRGAEYISVPGGAGQQSGPVYGGPVYGGPAGAGGSSAGPAGPAGAAGGGAAAGSTPAVVTVPVADENAGLTAIKSPMVGTFYASPGPDQKAFVQVGSVINEESDVCIIEAMKVFNNIKAEVRGTIARIVAETGKPVEFGQTLFLVKP